MEESETKQTPKEAQPPSGLFTFHIKLLSVDTPGFNPNHYVIYIRKFLYLKKHLGLEFYFESSHASGAYSGWMKKMKEHPDPDECRGYASQKYEDDINSRIPEDGDYVPVGRLQYPGEAVEILLKKSEHTTDVYFVSDNKTKLEVLYETSEINLSEMSKYGITMEHGPKPSEVTDGKLLHALDEVNQLIIVSAGDIGRFY